MINLKNKKKIMKLIKNEILKIKNNVLTNILDKKYLKNC